MSARCRLGMRRRCVALHVTEFFDLEVERMWTPSGRWRAAKRNAEPAIRSSNTSSPVLLITRQATVRSARSQFLPHAGRKLLLADERVEHFRCRSCFSWQLDGSGVRSRADGLRARRREGLRCRSARRHWALRFVNLDPGAIPLEQYLEVLPEHFARWRMRTAGRPCTSQGHPCNWKVGRSLHGVVHVIATHPQILSIIADAIRSTTSMEHVSRNLRRWRASPHSGRTVDPQQTLDDMLQLMVARAWSRDRAKRQRPRAMLVT